MLANVNIKDILDRFAIDGDFKGYREISDGHINYTVRADYEKNGEVKSYLLQRVNVSVFKMPAELMENVEKVTSFLREKVALEGGNPEREAIYCLPTRDGRKYVSDLDGYAWRVYNYVDNSMTHSAIESPAVFEKAGRAFGDFMKKLADYPGESLYETIPDFHNTAVRFKQLSNAIKADKVGRAASVSAEIAFAAERRDETYILIGKTATGELPVRVTHNDTKLNNILFDRDTDEPVCIVDLDTVMPGLSLYDFGDAIRFGANTAAEDEKDLSKVSLSLELYEAYTRGYLAAAGSAITPEEAALLPFGAKMMTLECGMRFLADYLDGDNYFRTDYSDHNLVRCRTQFALVADIEKKYDEMQAITDRIYREYCR